MKKQFFLLGAMAILGFTACNNSGTNNTTATDSTTTTTQSTVEKRGAMIPDFATRTFMDLKTNKPIKLHWDTVHYYYVDETGNQPYYFYDPAAKDTFDYWGRRLNNYLTYSNGDYMVDESRMPSSADMSTMTSTDTATNTTTPDNIKIKSKDGKYKEKTDTSKLKVTEDKMKVKIK